MPTPLMKQDAVGSYNNKFRTLRSVRKTFLRIATKMDPLNGVQV